MADERDDLRDDERDDQQIGYRVDGRVATISLDRPYYRNAQSRRLLDQLDEAFQRAVDDEAVRVIVLRGEGPHFSSGHDLGTPSELADREDRPWPDGWVGDQRRSWELNVTNTLRWRDLPKPTIAAVQGLCIYGGWMIASAMDLIVAADDARFLPAHFQYFSVPWDLGPRQTKELLWLAEFVDADQAHRLGFVNHVVPRAELDGFAADLAHRIARQDLFVSSMIKRSVNEMQDHQGFRTAITAAHGTYMQIQAAGQVMPPEQEGQLRRLPGVEASLRQDRSHRSPGPHRVRPMGEMVTFASNGLDARGHLAVPEGGSGPGVLVLQEWWGLNDQIKGVADRLAAQGFVALAPDLYHGELAGHDEMDKAGQLMTELPPDRAAKDMSGAVDYLLNHDATTGAGVGAIGFCMGGLMTMLISALRGDAVTAAMPFYGFPAADSEPDWSGLTATVRGHMASPDDFFTPEAAQALEARLQAMGNDVQFTIHEAGHAFMNETNAIGTFDEALANEIWPRVYEFFHAQLG